MGVCSKYEEYYTHAELLVVCVVTIRHEARSARFVVEYGARATPGIYNKEMHVYYKTDITASPYKQGT